MTISQEAIEAAHAEINKSWRNDRWEWDAPKHAAERALCAALPFLSTLPIAVEGKVKALEWTQGDEDPGYHFAQSSIGNYAITDFPVVGDDQLTVRLLGTSQYGTWFRTLDEAKAAANDDYTKRVLACLVSSPGKDGGQEVEAVKPSIDTMREAAWALLRKFGWQPTARLSLHQVSEVMAAFGMNVSRGEVGCGYPDCGCCADAACEDAIKQHADFRTQTASTALVESEDYFGRLVADARVSAVKAKRKFPQPNYVTLKIAEEAGEVVRGAVHYAENRMSWEEVEGEIIQLLAMLIRFVTEGDEINGVRPPALSASTSREGER